MASQGASSGASAIPADQPVDLAARPKSSPSAASPSTPKPVTATLQVKNTTYLLLIRDEGGPPELQVMFLETSKLT